MPGLAEAGEPARGGLAPRLFIAIAATLALLLLGAAAGLLVRVPDQQAPPAATPVDIGFAQDMSVHHQQAVSMATLARERASDQAVRQVAFDIETNQRDQIGRMQGWLSLWGQPAQATGAPMQWMQNMDHMHHSGSGTPGNGALMPGMATHEELAALQGLNGPAFDAQFLRLMLRHHEGGAPMAQYAAEHASIPAVRDLAQNMLSSQGTERSLMREMLADRGAQPLPPG